MSPADEGREVPVYACCPAGNRKWLWVAWDTSSEAVRGEPAQATGYEATAEAAEARAIEWAGPRARPLPAKWASDDKRRRAVEARRVRAAKAMNRPVKGKGDTTRLEFLYCASESDPENTPGHFVVVKHRIAKKTAAKIHVDREPFREDRGEEGREPSSPDRDPHKILIDRATLKREGRCRHPRSHRDVFFYATEEDAIRDVENVLESVPAWCDILGVKFPCSVEDVKAAYRRLAKKSHPDAGGDPSLFLAIEQAYRDGLAYCTRGTQAPPVPCRKDS